MSFIQLLVFASSDLWVLNHKITVDVGNKLIIVNPGTTSIDIKQDIYSSEKQWSGLRDYVKYRPSVRSIGGDPTVPGQTAGDIYFMTDGWRVATIFRETRVTGILFSDDFESPWANRNTGQPIYPAVVSSLVIGVDQNLPTATETAKEVWDYDPVNVNNGMGDVLLETVYSDLIYVSVAGGISGTGWPVGSRATPVNNINDALIVAQRTGARTLYIDGDVTVNSTDNISGYTIEAAHFNNAIVNLVNGCITDKTKFINCTVNGIANGHTAFINCFVDLLTGIEGKLKGCAIGGSLQFTDINNIKSLLVDCYSHVSVNGFSSLDLNLLSLELNIFGFIGNVRIINKTNILKMIINIQGGEIDIASSVTAGEITVGGIGLLINNSDSATVVNNMQSRRTWKEPAALSTTQFEGRK